MSRWDESGIVAAERQAEYEAKTEPPKTDLEARAEDHGFDPHEQP